MPISINNISSAVAKAAYAIENPSLPVLTVVEEVPTSTGRSLEGYRRGGVIEGTEKLRKELMAAVVWILGIPAFNKLGNLFCEKFLNLPMNVDFSDATKGNDAIKDTVEYVITGNNPKNLDVSSFKYSGKVPKLDVESVVKNVKTAKKITTISAVLLNCIMMGIVIPKFNQKLTEAKLAKMKDNSAKKPDSMDEFITKAKEPSFKGLGNLAYLIENNNKFRLISTDIPMIIGRMATSRNKYEALEYLVVDGGSIYFYNFCAQHIQKGARKLSHVPEVNPMVAQKFIKADKDELKNTIDIALQKQEISDLKELVSKESATEIYKSATFGKYGKINKFVSNDDIKDINNQVLNYLKTMAKKINYNGKNEFNHEAFIKEAQKFGNKNAAFLAVGLLVSIYGLARLMPRAAYKLTQMLTGKNTFAGIENYDDKK